jgi:hypothetical protein
MGVYSLLHNTVACYFLEGKSELPKAKVCDLENERVGKLHLAWGVPMNLKAVSEAFSRIDAPARGA